MTENRPESRISMHYVAAAMLLLCFLLLCWFSYEIAESGGHENNDALSLTALLTLSAVIYIAAVIWKPRGNRRTVVYFIFGAGIIFRLVTLFSPAVLEVDFYRYMWDGAVTSSGINPYLYSPEDVISRNTGIDELNKLATESGEIIHNINHKHLRTIYPPVTQFFFAVSSFINPWSLITWKFVLLVTDIVIFVLLVIILSKFNLSASVSIIYWWNPLLIFTTYNQAHFDIIPVVFVLLALLLALNRRAILSVTSLALGIGSKLWPLFIFPAIISSSLKNRRGYLLAASFLATYVFIIFIPVLISGLNADSGFVAYGTSWENNSSAFTVFLFMFEVLFGYVGIHPGHAQKFTRIFVLIVVSLAVVWLFFRKNRKDDIPFNLLAITGLLFLLSPTQFPWYYTWVLPFVVFKPYLSFLLPTLLLPLYYTGYYLSPEHELYVYRELVVWIEFVPVWLMILLEWRSGSFLKANG